MFFNISCCKCAGYEVDKPEIYTSLVSNPSGSKNKWCESLSENLTTLSSIEGQYLGPSLNLLLFH